MEPKLTPPVNTSAETRRTFPTSFDRVVLVAIVLLLLGIGGTVLLGDRVGVTLVRVAPLGTARSTSAVTIQFSEPMNRETVEQRISLEPEATGSFSWNGSIVSFRPDSPLEPGQAYTVVLAQGAQSQEGRAVLSEYRYSFTVAQPRVAYLAPADSAPQNVWVAELGNPDSARQVTFSPTGVYDFGVSPDGSQIAFAENNDLLGTHDIKLLDLTTGGIIQLTNCQQSDCTTPIWRPDGRVIAYNRVDYNDDIGSATTSPTRVWLLDLTTTPATTRPLFADLQILGYSPQWSANGRRISVYNRDEGILVYDFDSNNISAIPSRSGSSGALSPDGTRVVFRELIIAEGTQARSYLQIADLSASELRPLSSPEDPIQDELAEWRPTGESLAIARRYQDERYTRGAQVYLMDPADGSVRQLTEDPRYANAFFSWDPTGTWLVIQRFPELDENMQPNTEGRPEVWTLNVDSGEFIQLASNVYHPRWVP
jgi:Tol biopolymer transport system component